jgi:hypothetical protein
MKKTLFGALAIIMLLFVSCYEVNEEIVINENGGGTYLTKMDMSAMVQMIQSMAGEEELAKKGMDRVLDTTINLKNVMDSATNITAEQRKLYGDGTMKLQVNMKESLLKADINFPFKNYNDLQSLMTGSGMAGLGEAFKKVFASNDSVQSSAPTMQDQGMEQINNVYDVTVNKHSIIKKLNKEKYDQLMQKPEVAQAKQMMGSFEISYTTTIRLPRPVKKFDNPLIKLSDDKKTITMKYDIMKMLETPEKFSYSIEY